MFHKSKHDSRSLFLQILMTGFYVPFLNKHITRLMALLIVCVSLIVCVIMSFLMILTLLCHMHLFDGSIHGNRIRYNQRVINIYFVLKAIQLLIQFLF